MQRRLPRRKKPPRGQNAAGDRQNWPAVVAAAEKAGVKWLVVECEKRQNTYEDIEASAKNLRPLVSLVNALR